LAPKGRSREAQLSAVAAILAFIDRPVSERRLKELADKIWSPRSATFRKGQIRDWPNHFKERHMEAFEKLAETYLFGWGMSAI